MLGSLPRLFLSFRELEKNIMKQKNSKEQKIRIRLKAFDHRIIDQSAEKIVVTAQKSGAKVLGPIPLPTVKKVWCILKSPHVDKRGGEHYEIRIHKRLIDIHSPGPEFANLLSRLDLPAGVDIQVRL